MAKGKKQSTSPDQGSLFTAEQMLGSGGLPVLRSLRKAAFACTKCSLAEQRTLVVFGEGRPPAIVAFVGEAPSDMEDVSGHPFVGKSGHLMTRMIAAMGLEREDCFLTYAVLCRPPDNRAPTRTELDACREYLWGQLRAVTPKVIVALGRSAAQALLPAAQGVEHMRLNWYAWEGVPVKVTYPPAFLARPEGASFKSHAWLDLKAVLERLGLPQPTDEEARLRAASLRSTGFVID